MLIKNSRLALESVWIQMIKEFIFSSGRYEGEGRSKIMVKSGENKTVSKQ